RRPAGFPPVPDRSLRPGFAGHAPGQRLDRPLDGPATRVGAKRWEASWTIPYRSLKRRKPTKGERWGFQVVREQAATKETSCWSVQTGYGIDPAQWGDLVF